MGHVSGNALHVSYFGASSFKLAKLRFKTAFSVNNDDEQISSCDITFSSS